MSKKLINILLIGLMIAGIAFAANNFFSVDAEAQYVTWETTYEYNQGDKDNPDMVYFCNGSFGDCCTVNAGDPPKQTDPNKTDTDN
ncbi:MAG: hypothetical protein GY765_01540 [bacterium]|nr:hypothetical protein [bacterium]